MRKKFLTWVGANKAVIIVTFEVFWIMIFVLDRLMNANTVEIPQFIYVNF